MRLLIERAKADQVTLGPKGKAKKDWKPDAKQLALLCFLDHRPTFDAASDLLAIERKARFPCSDGQGVPGWRPPALGNPTLAPSAAVADG